MYCRILPGILRWPVEGMMERGEGVKGGVLAVNGRACGNRIQALLTVEFKFQFEE